MRVLYITNKPIFPLVDGGCVAMNQFSKILGTEYNVQYLCISTEKHPFEISKFPEEFKQTFNPLNIEINTKPNFWNALFALVTGKNYNLSRFKSKKIGKKITECLEKESFDIVICESIYSATMIETIRTFSEAKILVRTHNVEYELWKQHAKSSKFLKSFYLNSLSKSLKNEELALLSKVDGILTISGDDQTKFTLDGVNTPMITLPVNIDIDERINTFPSSDFHFIGSMNWHPNIEAVEILVTRIFPEIRKALPSAKLHLAGSFFSEIVETDEANGIIVHGFVQDKNSFIREHGIQLSPIRSGSGVRIKILESMALGTPIITTKLGVQGIENLKDSAIIICETDADFIDSAIKLVKNADLRRQVGMRAAECIQNNYSIQSIRSIFSEFVQKIT